MKVKQGDTTRPLISLILDDLERKIGPHKRVGRGGFLLARLINVLADKGILTEADISEMLGPYPPALSLVSDDSEIGK